ncbi:hydantoinase B/oxoprolinase family protein [Chloroflexota bacterium]
MREKTGIGEGGESLIHMLEESEMILSETGHYGGLEELELTTTDPMRIELFHSRLLAAVGAARETTKMISASPMVREVAELCVGLYTPEGDCVVQSTGISGHIPVMGEVVKWMIRQNYEEEIGISEGDLFCCNENAIAGFHPGDVYDLLPVFWQGELVAWAITIIMEIEIGAICPGGMPTAQTERFTDGLRICAEKVGSNDLLHRDFERSCMFKLRMGEMFLLDRKGAVAANIKVRQEMEKAIAEFGLDYFRRAVRELIEGERRGQLARVRMRTVPGRYRNCIMEEYLLSHLPVPIIHRNDQYVLIPLDFVIEPSGRYVLDFDGSGSWGWHPGNSNPSAMRGALGLALTETIAYSGMANEGTLLATELKVPYDTVLWPSTIFVPTAAAWSIPLNGYGIWLSMQSRAFFSRGFKEEVMAGTGVAGSLCDWAGRDHHGREPFGMIFAHAGTGGPAYAIRDATDCAFQLWNPEADVGNLEIWELPVPVVTLGARICRDTGGYGKYRGGCGLGNTLMVYKTPKVCVGSVGMQLQSKILVNSGMFGGYPSPASYAAVVAGANTEELIREKKPLVHDVGDLRMPDLQKNLDGNYHRYPPGFGLTEELLKAGDIVQNYSSSQTGGYGDPIERDPGLVKKDLDNGLCSEEVAKNVYCVVATYDPKEEEYIIDLANTKALRQKERKERLGKMPVKEWWHRRRETIVNRELDALLRDMYNDSLSKGKRWSDEFRAFWDLPEDFSF